MKYVLNFDLEIICSDNFLIPKLNKKFDYKNNKVLAYKVDNEIDIEKYCKISEKDVETIRENYFEKIALLPDNKELLWLKRYENIRKNLDYMNEKHIKLIFYNLNITLTFLGFNEEMKNNFIKKFLIYYRKLDNTESRQKLVESLENKILEFLKNKEFFYSLSYELLKDDYEFYEEVATKVKENVMVEPSKLEADYLKNLKTKAVYKTYLINKEKNRLTRGLNINEQKEYLLETNKLIINHISKIIQEEKNLTLEEIKLFRGICSRFDRILTLSMAEWE